MVELWLTRARSDGDSIEDKKGWAFIPISRLCRKPWGQRGSLHGLCHAACMQARSSKIKTHTTGQTFPSDWLKLAAILATVVRDHLSGRH